MIYFVKFKIDQTLAKSCRWSNCCTQEAPMKCNKHCTAISRMKQARINILMFDLQHEQPRGIMWLDHDGELCSQRYFGNPQKMVDPKSQNLRALLMLFCKRWIETSKVTQNRFVSLPLMSSESCHKGLKSFNAMGGCFLKRHDSTQIFPQKN